MPSGTPHNASKHEIIDLTTKEALRRAVPNYKNPHPLVITLRVSLYPDRTLGERIKKWRLEQGLFQRDLDMKIGVDVMTIVNWEKRRTKPTKKNLERIRMILGFEPSTI